MAKGFNGIVFVGCLLLGVGLGMLWGRTGAGSMIGLGAGFILGALVGDRSTRS